VAKQAIVDAFRRLEVADEGVHDEDGSADV